MKDIKSLSGLTFYYESENELKPEIILPWEYVSLIDFNPET